MAAILDGPHPRSEEFPVQLYVFHETDTERVDILQLMCSTDVALHDGWDSEQHIRAVSVGYARVGGE